jgi:MFS family permease
MPNQSVSLSLAATFTVQAMAAMALYCIPVFAPIAALDYGVPATQVGLFSAIAYFTAMTAGLLTGGFVARYGALRTGQFCMIFAACGMASFAFASPWIAIISAIFLGLNYGPVNPLSAHILTRVTTPKTRPLIFSIKQTGVTIGAAFAGVSVPFLITHFGWRTSALILAAAMLVTLALVQPLRKSLDFDRRPGAPLRGSAVLDSVRLIMKDPVTFHLAVMALIYSGVQLTAAAFLVIYLNDFLKLSLPEAGALFAALQIGGAFGRIFWGAISGALFSARLVLGALGVISAACLGALAFTEPGWSITALSALCFALGASSSGWNGVYLSEVASAAPRGKIGEVTGGVQFFMFAGAFITPPIFSAIAAYYDDFTIAYIVFAVFVGLTGLSLSWLSKYHRPEA